MGVTTGGRGGTVVQTASIVGIVSGAMSRNYYHGHVEHAYTAAKFGLIGLTRYDKL